MGHLVPKVERQGDTVTVNAEYQRALQKTYVVGKSVPEMLQEVRTLAQEIENADKFIEVKLDALVLVARSLEASYRKFNVPPAWNPENGFDEPARREALMRRWLDEQPHATVDCGPLCPEHGDPRDTNLVEEILSPDLRRERRRTEGVS